MKEIFKEGDRVFDLVYGWGKVINSTCPITVKFSEYTVDYYKKDLVKLSFTEYTLQGFSQERPIKLPEVGELCLVRDENHEYWIAKRFISYNPEKASPYRTEYDIDYKLMKRIKILD